MEPRVSGQAIMNPWRVGGVDKKGERMSDPFLGEIRIFGFNFAPAGWAFCNGQIMPITQNTALFALLGTTYGGNGTANFALPDLRGRIPIHQGTGSGLSSYDLGQTGGSQTVTLTTAQMPEHNHALNATTAAADTADPANEVLANANYGGDFVNEYAAGPGTTAMHSSSIGNSGGTTPVSVLQPFLVLNFCIALQGIFPSRN